MCPTWIARSPGRRAARPLRAGWLKCARCGRSHEGSGAKLEGAGPSAPWTPNENGADVAAPSNGEMIDQSSAREVAESVARRSYGKLLALLAARTRDMTGAEDALAEAF